MLTNFRIQQQDRLSLFKNLFNYLAVFIIFSEALNFQYVFFFDVRIFFFILIALLIFIIIKFKKIPFNKTFFTLSLFIACYSLLNIFLGRNHILLFAKQAVGIFLNALFFYLLIEFNDNDSKKLFLAYLNVAFFVGLIGLIQWFGYPLYCLGIFLHFDWFCYKVIKYLFDFSWFLPKWNLVFFSIPHFLRVNSIMPEPASFCIAMMPAFFVALASFFKDYAKLMGIKRRLVIILSFLFTFSAIGYIAILIAILLIFCNLTKNLTKEKNRAILSCMIMIFLILLVFFILPDFRIRAKDPFDYLLRKREVEDINRSAGTLIANALITYKVLSKNFIFGNGLGSHELSFDRYIRKVTNFDNQTTLDAYLNKKDAGSLLSRILSETGIFGFLILLIFIKRFYVRRKTDNSGYLWVINNAILVLFIMRLIRQGNYISEGFFFFFWLYYFTKKQQVNENQLSTVD